MPRLRWTYFFRMQNPPFIFCLCPDWRLPSLARQTVPAISPIITVLLSLFSRFQKFGSLLNAILLCISVRGRWNCLRDKDGAVAVPRAMWPSRVLSQAGNQSRRLLRQSSIASVVASWLDQPLVSCHTHLDSFSEVTQQKNRSLAFPTLCCVAVFPCSCRIKSACSAGLKCCPRVSLW